VCSLVKESHCTSSPVFVFLPHWSSAECGDSDQPNTKETSQVEAEKTLAKSLFQFYKKKRRVQRSNKDFIGVEGSGDTGFCRLVKFWAIPVDFGNFWIQSVNFGGWGRGTVRVPSDSDTQFIWIRKMNGERSQGASKSKGPPESPDLRGYGVCESWFTLPLTLWQVKRRSCLDILHMGNWEEEKDDSARLSPGAGRGGRESGWEAEEDGSKNYYPLLILPTPDYYPRRSN